MIDKKNDGPEVEKESEKCIWMNRLSKEIERAAVLCERISSKLSCVMYEEIPNEVEEENKVKELTSFSNEIRDKVQRISDISNVYERMLARIDL